MFRNSKSFEWNKFCSGISACTEFYSLFSEAIFQAETDRRGTDERQATVDRCTLGKTGLRLT